MKLGSETGTEPLAVAAGYPRELPACYRKQVRIRVELLFEQSRRSPMMQSDFDTLDSKQT